MSKVRINDLARELEVKSRQVLDLLTELGLGEAKMTHSSSIEDHEAEKVRSHFGGAKGASSGYSSRAPQGIQPKVDLSHISKPGDALKAILARKQEEEDARRVPPPARQPVAFAKAPATSVAPPAARPAAPAAFVAAPRPEPRRIVPQARQAPNIIAPPPTPAIASRPPANPVIAKAPVVAVAPPAAPRPRRCYCAASGGGCRQAARGSREAGGSACCSGKARYCGACRLACSGTSRRDGPAREGGRSCASGT